MANPLTPGICSVSSFLRACRIMNSMRCTSSLLTDCDFSRNSVRAYCNAFARVSVGDCRTVRSTSAYSDSTCFCKPEWRDFGGIANKIYFPGHAGFVICLYDRPPRLRRFRSGRCYQTSSGFLSSRDHDSNCSSTIHQQSAGCALLRVSHARFSVLTAVVLVMPVKFVPLTPV